MLISSILGFSTPYVDSDSKKRHHGSIESWQELSGISKIFNVSSQVGWSGLNYISSSQRLICVNYLSSSIGWIDPLAKICTRQSKTASNPTAICTSQSLYTSNIQVIAEGGTVSVWDERVKELGE